MSTYPNLPFLLDPPTNLDWLFKYEHGHVAYSDETIKRKLIGQLAPTTGHVAIVCVLGERGTGKSHILDAIIRRFVGKDVVVFATPFSHLDNRSHDLAIATSAILIPPTTSKDTGVLFVDVRSWFQSSPCYLKLMKIAFKLSSVKLMSHYRSLSPELSQLATKEDIIHIKPADVFWDGTKINLTEDLFAKVCHLIQDAGYAKHTTYFRLTQRLEKIYHDEIQNPQQAAEIPGQPNQRVESKTFDHSRPLHISTYSGLTAPSSSNVDLQGQSAYFDHQHQFAGNKQTYSIQQNTSTSQVQREVQNQHQEYGKDVQPIQPASTSNTTAQVNSISCAEAMYQAFLNSNEDYFDENELLLKHASAPHSLSNECAYSQLQDFHRFLENNYSHWIQGAQTQVTKAMDTAESEFIHRLVNSDSPKLEVAFDSTIPEGFANAVKAELRYCPFREVEIVVHRWQANVTTLFKSLSDELEKQFQATVSIIDDYSSILRQFLNHDHCLRPKEFAKVAEGIYSKVLSKKPQITRPALQNAISQCLEQIQRSASEENGRLFKIEYARALQAVQYAVDKFKAILPSDLPALMTTKDQNNLLSSYGAMILTAFNSFSKGSAWKYAADKKLWPALEGYMSELRQANKNTMRRWDKALDSALRQCGQVYHAEMQRRIPSKTKVSTSDLESHHLSAVGPTLPAFSIPAEVNLPTRGRWEVVLKLKLEEWKGGFVYLNEKTPEPPAKVPLCSSRKEEASVGIYLGKTSILFAVCVKEGDRSATFQKQLSPYISLSQQGVQVGEDCGDFNIYDVLTEPTVPRDPKPLQLGQDLHLITQEMAAVLFMYEAKKIVDDFCGRDVSHACVTIPHFISGAAKTAIKQSLLNAGFANVQLFQFTVAMAMNLVQQQPHTVGKVTSIHHSTTAFEISRIAVEPNSGLTVEKTWWSDRPTTKCVTKCVNSAIEKHSAPPLAVLLQEEEGCSANIVHLIRSFDFRVPRNAFYSIQPWDTTIAIAKYAELRRQQLTAVLVNHHSPYNIKSSGVKFIETQDASTWICHPKSKADGDFLIHDGIDKDSGKLEPLWSYYFQISPPGVTGPMCRFKFETDGSLGVERLAGVNTRVESKTSKFLSQWDREILAEDVKRYLAVLCQPESTKDVVSEEGVAEQDDTVRGKLSRLIQRVQDSLEDPTFAAGPDRDFLSERVKLYSHVLANESTRERDLDKALQKLQAVTEGIL